MGEGMRLHTIVDFTAYDDNDTNDNDNNKLFLSIGYFTISQTLSHWPDSQQNCGRDGENGSREMTSQLSGLPEAVGSGAGATGLLAMAETRAPRVRAQACPPGPVIARMPYHPCFPSPHKRENRSHCYS